MSSEDLIPLQRPDLFEKFKDQFKKDYELSGLLSYLPVMVSNELNYIHEQVYQSVVQLDMSHALKVLLYRVDITEMQIKKATHQYPDRQMQHIIADLMIKRILQKVILKDLYSK